MSQNPQWDDGASGSRYLGSFIGEATERDSWIANKVMTGIKRLSGVECIFCTPDSAQYDKNGRIHNAQHQALNFIL